MSALGDGAYGDGAYGGDFAIVSVPAPHITLPTIAEITGSPAAFTLVDIHTLVAAITAHGAQAVVDPHQTIVGADDHDNTVAIDPGERTVTISS